MARHPRVLITGADGQVGRALRPLIPDARFATRGELDVTDRDSVRAAVQSTDVVIHLAALTRVDDCEVKPEIAMRINGSGTKNVVDAAREAGARVIYLSTDYVFDGVAPGEYAEDDATRPINAYGRSKLEGERSLDPEDDLIVRSSWIFGDGKNFVATILSLARSRSVRVVADQCGRPTSASSLASALVHAIGQELAGTLHIAGEGHACSWAELARAAISAAGMDQSVIPIDTKTYVAEANRVIAPRPANSALALDKARSLGVPLLDWRMSVFEYVERSY